MKGFMPHIGHSIMDIHLTCRFRSTQVYYTCTPCTKQNNAAFAIDLHGDRTVAWLHFCTKQCSASNGSRSGKCNSTKIVATLLWRQTGIRAYIFKVLVVPCIHTDHALKILAGVVQGSQELPKPCAWVCYTIQLKCAELCQANVAGCHFLANGFVMLKWYEPTLFAIDCKA